jgi:hypothetical protein
VTVVGRVEVFWGGKIVNSAGFRCWEFVGGVQELCDCPMNILLVCLFN